MFTGRNGKINIRDLFTNNVARISDTTGAVDAEELTAESFIAPIGNLVLTGTAGNDRLVVRGGDDRLSGGLVRDDLTGNGGADTIVLAPSTATSSATRTGSTSSTSLRGA